MIGKYAPDEWQAVAVSPETLALVDKCKKIIAAMDVLDEERTYDNFMYHFNGEDKKPKAEVKHEEPEEPSNNEKSFIDYMESALAKEDLREGTRRHKKVVIDAIRSFGRLNTYGDITPKGIIAFDNWLHDGTRTDVTCYGYHKKLHKWVRQLFQMGEIAQDPYQVVTLKRGKSKEREPLTELELKMMRSHKFEPKLERVRDLFIFAAYTGLRDYIGEQLSYYSDEGIFKYKKEISYTKERKTSDWLIYDNENIIFLDCKLKKLTIDASKSLSVDNSIVDEIIDSHILKNRKMIERLKESLPPLIKDILSFGVDVGKILCVLLL